MAKVLVVDDALFMRKMLIDILKKEGFEVCGEAENGKDAIEQYKQLKPDLVTMDIVMPKMDEVDGIGDGGPFSRSHQLFGHPLFDLHRLAP